MQQALRIASMTSLQGSRQEDGAAAGAVGGNQRRRSRWAPAGGDDDQPEPRIGLVGMDEHAPTAMARPTSTRRSRSPNQRGSSGGGEQPAGRRLDRGCGEDQGPPRRLTSDGPFSSDLSGSAKWQVLSFAACRSNDDVCFGLLGSRQIVMVILSGYSRDSIPKRGYPTADRTHRARHTLGLLIIQTVRAPRSPPVSVAVPGPHTRWAAAPAAT